MSAYIHPENQQLLWTIVNSNSLLSDTFSSYTPLQKDEWFKSIIEIFYKKIGDVPLSKTQLHQINKDTLAYMIQLSHRSQFEREQQHHQSLLQKTSSVFPDPDIQKMQTATSTLSHQQPFAHKQEDMFVKQFQEKEREYKTLLETRKPDAVDFREKVEDTAISNMEELIKQHQAEREKEFEIYRPKPPNEKVDENITFQVEPEQPIPLSPEEIDQLKQRVLELTKDMSVFSDELNKIKTILSSSSILPTNICR
jgi:hypothetical protein